MFLDPNTRSDPASGPRPLIAPHGSPFDTAPDGEPGHSWPTDSQEAS